MAFKALFNKESRKERALQKACAKAVNKKIKPDDRRPALEQLLADGGKEAVLSLLGRFTFNYDINMVSDEEEKSYVYQGLVELGDKILPALREHLKRASTLSWDLKLVDELCDREKKWEIVAQLLGQFEPGYDRDPSRKIQLLSFLGEFDDSRVPAAVVPYLEDHDETVRFATVETLIARADEETAREPLLKLLIDEEEESLRIKNRIAESFVELEWTVKGYRGTVEKILPPEYVVDGRGRIRHKRARK